VKEIHSISFQEDFFLWTEMTIDGKTLHIRRAVSDSLPLSINYQTIHQSTATKQIANHLSAIAQKYELHPGTIRFSIPARFSLIKRLQVDAAIPPEEHQNVAAYTMEKIWGESPDNYHVYLPDFLIQEEQFQELLMVAIRKNVVQFFEEVAAQAQMEVEIITPDCFTVEEFFRTIHPDFSGQALLLGWQRRGYDVIVSSAQNFLEYQFKPYNSQLESIEQIDEEDLLSKFDVLIEELQQPSVLDKPRYQFNAIYLFGFHFKPEWLEPLRAQTSIPIHLFNLENTDVYRLAAESQEMSSDRLYQMIQPISNIF
jgi:hypothetical protein